MTPGPSLVCPGCGSPDVDLRRGPLCGTCASVVAEEAGFLDRAGTAEAKLAEILALPLLYIGAVAEGNAVVSYPAILAIIGGEEEPVIADVGHPSASDRAMVARATGGGIRSRELQVKFSDEEEA